MKKKFNAIKINYDTINFNRIKKNVCFNLFTFKPVNCQFWIADGFKTSFKVCKASLTNFQLIFDGRLELGRRRGLDGLRLAALGQRQLIGFQFLNALDVALLFWDAQVTGDSAAAGHLDGRLTDGLSLAIDGLHRVHSSVFGTQMHDV